MKRISITAAAAVALALICTCAGVALPQSAPSASPQTAAASAPADHASSYYHFMLARRLEELGFAYNRPDDVKRAISEFKQAIADNPTSLYLHTQLGQLEWQAGQTPEAVAEAQYALKRDPDNLDAHRLLGDIYLHDLGQSQGQAQQSKALKDAIAQYEAVTRLAPDDTRSAVLLGRLYWLNNEPGKAEDAFKKVLGSHPNSASALSYLGKLLMDQGEYRQALTTLQKIPDNERSPSALEMLGTAYSQTGDLDRAIATYKEALSADPENSDVRRKYADALMQDGKLDAARQQFEKVLKANSQDGLSYLRLAQLNQAEGHFNKAKTLLAQARALLPDDPGVDFQDALLLHATGNDAKAIALLQGLLKNSTRADGHYSPGEASNRAAFLERLGIIYRSSQNYPKALAAFREIAAMGGAQGPQGEALVIETLQTEGKRSQALEEATKAVAKYPKSRSLAIAEATLLGLSGHAPDAVAHLKAIERANGDPQIELAIAQVYLNAKKYHKAQEVTERVLDLPSLKSDQRENAQFMLGAVYDRQKKYDRAEEQFKTIVASDPLNADAFNYLGYMLANRGVELPQSVAYIKKALQIEPQNAAFLDSLGWAYFKMARYDMALPPLEKAAQKLSTDPTVLDHLGNVYLKLGKTKQAAETWRLALKQFPSATDSDFTAAQAAKLQKQLSRVERELAKNESRN